MSKPKGTRGPNYYWRQWIKADRIGQLKFLFANKEEHSSLLMMRPSGGQASHDGDVSQANMGGQAL